MAIVFGMWLTPWRDLVTVIRQIFSRPGSLHPLISPVLPGQLPTWLSGNLYRNGSGVKEIGPDKYSHLFEGLACVHKFHIDGAGSQVTYQVSGGLIREKMPVKDQNKGLSEFGMDDGEAIVAVVLEDANPRIWFLYRFANLSFVFRPPLICDDEVHAILSTPEKIP